MCTKNIVCTQNQQALMSGKDNYSIPYMDSVAPTVINEIPSVTTRPNNGN